MELAKLLNDKTLKHELPPNWEELKKMFPAIEGQEQRIIFTYFPHIYMPREIALPPDLAVHESIHLHQQSEMTPGVWWENYIQNKEFRLHEELIAYGAQLHWWSAHRNAVFKLIQHQLATDLSSEFYGNIISYSEASTQIKKIAKSLGLKTKFSEEEKE